MSEERERYEVSGQEHAADGARTAKRSAGLSTENPNAPQQRAHHHDLPRRMRAVAAPPSTDDMSNREYWLRTELWQFSQEIVEVLEERDRYFRRMQELVEQCNKLYEDAIRAREDAAEWAEKAAGHVEQLQQAYQDYLKLEALTQLFGNRIADLSLRVSQQEREAWDALEPWQRERLHRG